MDHMVTILKKLISYYSNAKSEEVATSQPRSPSGKSRTPHRVMDSSARPGKSRKLSSETPT